MSVKTYIKVGGAVIGFAYSAYQIMTDIAPLPPMAQFSKYSWINVGIGFLVFAGFVIWGWGSASYKLKQHEDTHPDLRVIPVIEGKYAFIEIENTGHEQADFEVQISAWSGIEGLTGQTNPYYCGKWLLFNIQNPTAFDWKLKAGASNKIILAEDDGIRGFESDLVRYRELKLPCCQNIERHGKLKLDTYANVTIEIFSEPSLKKPFKRNYYFSLNEKGQWTQFEEIKQ